MYMLDTNTLIYFFKGMGNIANNLFLHPPMDIFVPSIVIYELEVGIAKSDNPDKRRSQLKHLLEQVQIVDFTQKEASAAAQIRAELEKVGAPIGPVDTLIAGCALANNSILVTRNIDEFGRVKNLAVESWF